MNLPNPFAGASHLECTGTGDRVESEELHGLSAHGKPLFARYDLDSLRDVA
jgi:threonine synthase